MWILRFEVLDIVCLDVLNLDHEPREVIGLALVPQEIHHYQVAVDLDASDDYAGADEELLPHVVRLEELDGLRGDDH